MAPGEFLTSWSALIGVHFLLPAANELHIKALISCMMVYGDSINYLFVLIFGLFPLLSAVVSNCAS